MSDLTVKVLPLGQAGFRIEFGSQVVYLDPYLSNYVEEVEGPGARRLFPIVQEPAHIVDADWVLISHEHLDHCDPKTLLPLSASSPACHFIGPLAVVDLLADMGISRARLLIAREEWHQLAPGLRIHAVPAAHTLLARDTQGFSRYVGYVIDFEGCRIYHSGDTSPHEELISMVANLGPIDYAFIPVNERNYYRDRCGIVGNMSIREAFRFALDIGAKTVIPMHWDMFSENSTYVEEIELLFNLLSPAFEISIRPQNLSHRRPIPEMKEV